MKEYPRKVRLNSQLQHELSDLIRAELSDPRIKNVTVTAADVAPDLRNAKVLVSVLGSDEELAAAVAGLNHAAGKLRHELAKRLRLRTVPTLRFVPDLALREGDRIGALINRAVADDRRGREPGEVAPPAMAQGKLRRRDVDGILLLDKPLGLSSNQALQQVKRLYRAEKAGHTGSLDPLATGMLPVCFGQATKLSAFLLDSDKRYLASVRLGVRTATGDAEGAAVGRSDPSAVTAAALAAVLPRFLGTITQIPPMHSALKHEGQRLYDLARAGIEVERSPRAVTVHALALVRFEAPSFDLDLRCSKGTYVRTLAEDVAATLGQCAHLAGLRRLEVTPFGDGPLVTMAALERAAAEGGEPALDALLLPPAAAVAGWPQVTVDADRAFYLGRGQAVRVGGAPPAGLVAVLDPAGSLLGIGAGEGGGMVAPRRWLAPAANP